jgi:hypothetical protein
MLHGHLLGLVHADRCLSRKAKSVHPSDRLPAFFSLVPPPQVRMPITPSKFPISKHIAASMYNASCVLGRYVGRMAASTSQKVE